MGVEGCKIMVHEQRKKRTLVMPTQLSSGVRTLHKQQCQCPTQIHLKYTFLSIVLQISHFFSGVCKALE